MTIYKLYILHIKRKRFIGMFSYVLKLLFFLGPEYICYFVSYKNQKIFLGSQKGVYGLAKIIILFWSIAKARERWY